MTRGIRAALTGAVLASALVLTGCMATNDFHAAAAETLQERVLHVTEASAGADYDTALRALAMLEVETKDALARGFISAHRHDTILAALALVRADLEGLLSDDAPAQGPADSGNSDDSGNSGNNGDDGNNGNRGNSGNNGNNGNNGNGNNGNQGNNGNGNSGGNDGGDPDPTPSPTPTPTPDPTDPPDNPEE